MASPFVQARRELELTDAAKDYLAEIGYDPASGARSLRRAIQEHVLEPRSEKIIAGAIRPGSRVVVDRERGRVTLRSAPGEAAA